MSLFGSLQVSASGMAAERARAELLVENMANSETTRTPEGGPYRRKDVVFSSQPQTSPFSAVFQNEVGTGVAVSDVITDQRDPVQRYMPGHPDADANGYVAFPNMNPSEDMVDLLNSQRSYSANVAAISSVKDMISRSIDIMRS
jgi:flagellar basal-body rod protein FlgC